MTQPSGWYDDPQDLSQLRYWDGVVWSSNVTPRVSPSVEKSTIGMPLDLAPAAARPQDFGLYGAPGPPSAPGSFGSPQQGQQGGQPPAFGQQDYGQHPGSMAPQQPGSGWGPNSVPSTPDGVPLSGWWKRALARFLDGIIVFIGCLPLTFVPLKRAIAIFWEVVQMSLDAAKTGSTTSSQVNERVIDQLSAEMGAKVALVSVIVLFVYLAYEVTLLTLTGATLGKKAVGISVRLRAEPGPPPLLAVLMRTAVKEGGGLLKVQVLVYPLRLFSLLNVLWPLWDGKKQALHDKVAKTNVVVGPQPKRGA